MNNDFNTRDVTIYSFQPILEDFKLSGNPYKSSDVRRQLQDMGIFFYRDSEHSKAVFFPSDSILERQTYHSAGILNPDFEIDEWSNSNNDSEEITDDDVEPVANSNYFNVNDKPQKLVTKKAWMCLNDIVVIKSISDRHVKIY